jgi:hypothetical protein
MKFHFTVLLSLTLFSFQTIAQAEGIIERRIWIEKAFEGIGDAQCSDKIKTWRCLFPYRENCMKELKVAYDACARNSLPELPEYIDGPETKAQASKVIVECITAEIAKSHIIQLSKEKMQEYNECTGAAARTKPFSPNLQKAQEFSGTQLGYTCSDGSYIRKCFTINEASCKDELNKGQRDCTMKMETEGISIKSEDSAIQEVGRKITDCALANLKKAVAGLKKKSSDKECN